MSHREHVEALSDALRRSVSPDVLDGLARFAGLVESWNRKMNLTAAREPLALSEVLFADALMLADEHLTPRDARVLDVGSGAGAPAIPVALLRPDLAMTLVEPLHKRVAFMRHAVGSLGIAERVTVLERKLLPGDEALPGSPFDVAMSRATLAPQEWLSLGLPRAPRVLVLAADGPPPTHEGARHFEAMTYALPSSGAQRIIWKYERLEH